MACLRPLVRVVHENTKKLYKNGKIAPVASIISQFEYQREYEKIKSFSDGMIEHKVSLIPCGQCIGCRLDYSREWANRCAMEAKLHEHNWFLTLTYNDEHLPMKDFAEANGKIYPRRDDWAGTLEKSDLQKFFKRLRKRGISVRYLACGEYGGQGARPHYHAILFGSEFDSDTFYNARYVNNNLYWQNKVIESCWQLGYSYIGEANWNTMAYVARYVVKKQRGQYAADYYAERGQEPEFLVSSRRPAIGQEYYNLHADEIYRDDKILLHNTSGNFYAKPPRYFDKLRCKYDDHAIDDLKEARKVFGEQRQAVKDTASSVRRKQQMEIEERSLTEKSRQLKRDMVVKARDATSTTGYHAQPRSGNPRQA